MMKGLKTVVAICAALWMAACGGDDNNNVSALQGLNFSASQYSLSIGASLQPELRATIAGVTAVYDAEKNTEGVVWSVADKSVATVSTNGTVTAVAAGETTLTAQAAGKTATARLTVSQDWVGEWKITSWSGSSNIDGRIYLVLTDDWKFELYQNLNNYGYTAFKGTYTVTVTSGSCVLSGSYSDGTALSDNYTLAIEANVLTLTASKDSKQSKYARTTIPDGVKDGVTGAAALPLNRAKSETPFL